MPVVAVIGGIASAAAGVSAGFSLAAGFTLANVAAGLQIVGGVASALGGITGNKKLMKIGMVAGLGGAALGGLNALTSTASSSSTAGATAGLSTPGAVDYGLTSGAGSATSGLGVQVPANTATGLGSGFANAAPTVGLAEGGGMLSQAATSPVLPQSQVNPTPLEPFGAPGGQSANLGLRSEVSQGGVGDVGGTSSMWDKATGLLKNPEIMKVGMGALQGMSQQKAAQAQLEYQEQLKAQERERINRSILGQTRNY